VSRKFGTRTIIKDFNLRIQRGDRIGIVGSNGAGKTTLIRLLTGELEPDAGTVTRAKTLSGIVIDQQRKLLAPQKRVRDVLSNGSDWIDVRGRRKHVQAYLKDFLFEPSLIDARIGTLSGGERSRILLAREFAREANLLVLDEPTNDLDLETLDLLQEVIADYDGTVLIVSHDRDFLDKTVTLTLGLQGDGKVDVIVGGYADWEAKRDIRFDNGRKPAKQKPAAAQNSDEGASKETQKKAKLSYKDQRDYDEIPAQLEEIDNYIARAQKALANPDLYAENPEQFHALTTMIERKATEKQVAEERWLELAMILEKMEQ